MTSARLHVVGVRHHSPACARLVEHVLGRVRPRFVLIEGPSDMNPRLDELLLGHTLPVAVFSYHREAQGVTSSWSPFCAYSPEWRALVAGRAAGAEVRFIDLPAWDKAFWGVENRYGDRESEAQAARHERAVASLCNQLHVDGYDALWDHLFEGACDTPAQLDTLGERLALYFHHLRGNAPGDARDGPREALMQRWIAAALAATDEPVLVVCGGYHAPVLEGVEPAPPGTPWPTLEPPAEARSWVVPWSYRRLDAFIGYASGMPSPAFYDAVFEFGATEGPSTMLREIVEALRGAGQPVSSADLIAASALAEGLARVRGHDTLRRTDLLDGLGSALVKQVLDAPLPWSQRGPIARHTDPLLVAILRALSGRREGRLHPSTPLPPLVAEVQATLERHGLSPGPAARTVKLALATPEDLARSRVLHQLRMLQIPGFARTRGPNLGVDVELTEVWTVATHDLALSALIEAAQHGATLAGAAGHVIEERLDAPAVTLDVIAALLADAVFVGLDTLTTRALAAVERHARAEAELERLGSALGRLLVLFGGELLFGAAGRGELAAAIAAAFARGLWLLEQLSGGSSPRDRGLVAALVALRDAARLAPRLADLVDAEALGAVLDRRAQAEDAPPALRGACLGAAWSLGRLGAETEAVGVALGAVRRAARPETLGDFLAGLFALARAETVHGGDVLAVVDEVLAALEPEDFLVALPALRLAFGHFPPREKAELARRIATLHGRSPSEGHALLRLAASAEAIAAARALDARVEARMRALGWGDPS